jgi:pilus assembly protein Flp/PilA
MQKMNDLVLSTFIKTFAADRKGVTAIEYGLIAGLIAVAIIAAITALGGSLGNLFNTVNNSVKAA